MERNCDFSPRNQAASGKVELDWETDVVDADINTDISEVVTSVKVLGRDYVKDQDVDYKASSSDIKGITSGTSAIDARKKKIGATGPSNQPHALYRNVF